MPEPSTLQRAIGLIADVLAPLESCLRPRPCGRHARRARHRRHRRPGLERRLGRPAGRGREHGPGRGRRGPGRGAARRRRGRGSGAGRVRDRADRHRHRGAGQPPAGGRWPRRPASRGQRVRRAAVQPAAGAHPGAGPRGQRDPRGARRAGPGAGQRGVHRPEPPVPHRLDPRLLRPRALGLRPGRGARHPLRLGSRRLRRRRPAAPPRGVPVRARRARPCSTTPVRCRCSTSCWRRSARGPTSTRPGWAWSCGRASRRRWSTSGCPTSTSSSTSRPACRSVWG